MLLREEMRTDEEVINTVAPVPMLSDAGDTFYAP